MYKVAICYCIGGDLNNTYCKTPDNRYQTLEQAYGAITSGSIHRGVRPLHTPIAFQITRTWKAKLFHCLGIKQKVGEAK